MAYMGYTKKGLAKAQDKPGGSNVGQYKSNNIFAGPAGGAPRGSYPISRNGRLSIDRAKSAIKLAHNAPNPTGLKRFVGNKLKNSKGNKTMANLGKRILAKLANKKDDKSTWGGNKGDESSSKRDYPNYKGTDKGYKSKVSGEAHGDRSKSRRDYKRK